MLLDNLSVFLRSLNQDKRKFGLNYSMTLFTFLREIKTFKNIFLYIGRIDKKANSNSVYRFKFSFAMIQLEVFCFSFALMAVRKGFQTLLRFNVLSG